jgi:hypothetical protein
VTDLLAATQPAYPSAAALRGRVGVVIPAWFAPETAPEAAAALLLTTLAGSDAVVAPHDVIVVADGSPVAAAAAAALRERLGHEWGYPFQLLELPENQGKGAALVAGMRALLRDGDGPAWIATRDADGDHFVDDLPHLFRVGEQVATECPGQPVCVLGRRASVHAPLGWVRGEYEWLLNEVIIDAISFARAGDGGVWDTRYLVARVPDLQSGYKLYQRQAAAHALAALQGAAAARPELDLWRTGMEIVPFVSLALARGIFAEVERKAYFDQPVTSYGRLDLPRFYGDKLAWALRRCGLPAYAAALLIDGALARRPLYLDPQGRADLLRLRALVLDHLGPGSGVPPEPRARKYL